MYTAEYKGINSFLVGASKLLIKEGVKRITRGHTCWELPAPFMFKISDPTARIVTIPQRKWNPILPFAESLWIALGINDLEFIGYYLKTMENFSDDKLFLRGGYGPRIRKYNGNIEDYKCSRQNEISNHTISEADQLKFVIDLLKQDINSRQAIISIGDPLKDCFKKDGDIKMTKDFPCTRSLHFQKHPTENKLNLTVHMRSNDIMWGASAVNIFNFTFMQEYISQILGLEIGEYYQIVDNFHFYDDFKSKIIEFARIEEPIDIGYKYSKGFSSFLDFEQKLILLSTQEEKLRRNQNCTVFNFNDDFFNDWYKTFYQFNTREKVVFANPQLNNISKRIKL